MAVRAIEAHAIREHEEQQAEEMRRQRQIEQREWEIEQAQYVTLRALHCAARPQPHPYPLSSLFIIAGCLSARRLTAQPQGGGLSADTAPLEARPGYTQKV